MLKEDNIDTGSVQKLLLEVQAFQSLDNKVISDIASRVRLVDYEAGEHVIWAGGLGQYLLVIGQGTVYVSLDSRDIELGRGDIVGEMALLSHKPSKADVVALTDVNGIAVDQEDFHALIEMHAGLATAMTELMKSRMFGDDGINRLGDYRVMDQIGKGSMSDVYNAVDTVSGRVVAIKMLNYEQTSQADFKARFSKDIDAIIKLKHPNILQVLETVEDYSTEFIVMEKLEANNLKYYLDKDGCFDGKQTSRIISKVALALEYSSNDDNGAVVHGDVNLSNIVLDDAGDVKLMNFGVASSHTDKTVSTDNVPPYMAPEVLRNEAYDFRIDIYALGVAAFKMLSGKSPFAAASAEQIISNPPPDIKSVVSDVPDGLAEFIDRAMTKDPEQRISSWFEIQTLLASVKGSSLSLLDDTDKDMAVVIKLQTPGVDTKILNQELHQLLSKRHVEYEMEVVTRENTDVDFTH